MKKIILLVLVFLLLCSMLASCTDFKIEGETTNNPGNNGADVFDFSAVTSGTEDGSDSEADSEENMTAKSGELENAGADTDSSWGELITIR